MRAYNWNPFQAFEFVKQQRERAKPNASFWNQINQYHSYWSKQPPTLQNQPTSAKENQSTVQ
jgi:hypothetical protein